MNLIIIFGISIVAGLAWIITREIQIMDAFIRMINVMHQYNMEEIKKGLYPIHRLDYDSAAKLVEKNISLKVWIPIKRIENKMLLEIDRQKIVNRLLK